MRFKFPNMRHNWRAPRHPDRGLTPGEIELLRPVFRDALDYASVKVHNHGYWMLCGFQPTCTAMAPNGQLYLPGKLFEPDFSQAGPSAKRLFVHEMVHVWQFQMGYPVKRVRAPRPNMSYAYTLREGASLADFNMEAQANLIADYLLLKCHDGRGHLFETKYAGASGDLAALYERCLQRFLQDPTDTLSLPAVTR